MGANQSRTQEPALNNEKLVIERLRALQIKDHLSEDLEYVHIDNEKRPRKLSSQSPELSVSAVEQWEKTLLQDPKNR